MMDEFSGLMSEGFWVVEEFVEKRVCSDCSAEKDLNKKNFYWRNDRQSFMKQCKDCFLDIQEKRKMLNPEKERIKQREGAARWRKKHPDKVAEQQKKYNTREFRNKHNRIRYKDPIFRLRKKISRDIRNMLKANGGSKNGKGCWAYMLQTPREIKTYIETLFSHPDNLTPDGKIWMTWENNGPYIKSQWDDNDPSTWVWHIDHIFPVSRAKFSSLDDPNLKIIWEMHNMRPLSAKQNHQDQDKRTDEQIATIKNSIANFLAITQ